MRRTAYISFILLIVVLLFIPLNGRCESSPPNIKEGKTLHLHILARNKKIDKFYREPFVWGSGTNRPLCCISVPVRDWESLPESKKQTLAHYAASLVGKVKANPFKYAGVKANAPAALAVRGNIAGMTDDSWCIMTGAISPDGRDIGADQIARSGK